MGSFSIVHWLVVLLVVMLLFGSGNKLSGFMGDFAKGIKTFKKTMAEDSDESMEANAGTPKGSLSGPGAPTGTTTSQTTAAHNG